MNASFLIVSILKHHINLTLFYWECTDVIIGGNKWHDSDGSTYDCNWYSEADRCVEYGEEYAWAGLTATQACW